LRALDADDARESLQMVTAFTLAQSGDAEAHGALLAQVIGKGPAALATAWAQAQRAAKEA